MVDNVKKPMPCIPYLQTRLASHFGEAERDGGGGSFGVVGLHTCGDLGALLTKLFAESERAAYLQGRLAPHNLDA